MIELFLPEKVVQDRGAGKWKPPVAKHGDGDQSAHGRRKHGKRDNINIHDMPEAKDAIMNYRGYGHEEMNTNLRAAGKAGMDNPISGENYDRSEVAILDKVIDVQPPSTEVTYLYRGGTADLAEKLKDRVGKVVVDYGFMSTTTDREISTNFTLKGGVKMSIKVPVGHKFLDCDDFSGYKDQTEKEFILPRGTKLGIKRMEYDRFDDIYLCEAVVLPQ